METSKSRSGVIDGKMAGLYDLEATLGRGHFAVVKQARHVFTGEKVAVKVIDKLKLDEISRAHLFQEVRCMKLVQHPNVVRLYEVIDTQTKLYLVLELADGGDLYDYIMKHESGLSEPLAMHYFAQIVRAISYCHRLHVVHRDLKPENVVFFERTQVVKLTDFGFSNKFCPGEKLETSCGSLSYSAPEILLGDSYDAPAVDVWSLGVILYMLVCGQAPFQEANDSETLTMIMDCKYSVPPHISSQCKELIGKMLVREPEKRASLADIAKHPWLAGECLTTDLPLVSSQQLLDTDKNTIIQKMVNGNICTKEQIIESLEKNEYNYLTATYFLLAERMLRSLEPKSTPRLSGRNAPMVQVDSCKENDSSTPSKINQNYLSMARGQGDVVQRSRKCSIVAEDEEEESSSSREGSSLNRRGSRSEGKLYLAVQEIHRQAIQINSITEASTAPGPLHPSSGSNVSSSGTTASPLHTTPIRGVKSLPSPIGSTASSPQLGPISSINRYERRNKLRKASTASCSSSDASDEDSETRNKRKGSNKSLERGGSGGQDPGASSGGSGSTSGQGNSAPPPSGNTDSNSNPPLDQNSTGRRQCLSGRRRRGCETRLRESQSLNRITEVQESEAGGGSAAANHTSGCSATSTLPHSAGANNHRLSSDSSSVHSVSMAGGDTNINQGNTKRNTLLGRYLSLQKKFCLPLIGRGRLYKVPKDINQNLGPPTNQVKQQTSKN